MLKLIKWEVPTWTIDWVNKEFKTSNIIWGIIKITVDWVETTSYNYYGIQINLDVAPASSIVIDEYFARALPAIKWTWELTLSTLVSSFYSKIGRVNIDWTIPANISKLYPQNEVKKEIRHSVKRITNKSPSNNRIQQYTTQYLWGYKVIGINSENVITLEQSLENDISGSFMIENGTVYDFYNVVDNKYQVRDADITEIWDRVIIGHKIPTWVQKISSIYVNGTEMLPSNELSFNIYWDKFTIITDFQGQRYIFLPYMDKVITVVVKYIPDLNWIYDDDDIINFPEEYSDVIVYDVAYRMLMSREDGRWMSIKQELWDGTIRTKWILYEYQSFIKSNIQRGKNKIWFAKT